MGSISRRTFLKASGATAGVIATEELLFGKARSLVQVTGESSTSNQLAERWVHSNCWIGKQDCGLVVRKIGNRVVKLEGNP